MIFNLTVNPPPTMTTRFRAPSVSEGIGKREFLASMYELFTAAIKLVAMSA